MTHQIRGDPNKEKEFSEKFGFKDGLSFRSAEVGEEVGTNDDRGGVPIHNINFFECGVRVPFLELLVDFFHFVNLAPIQLKPNAYKVVLGVVELNRILGTKLKVEEIVTCYQLARSQGGHYLKVRDSERVLVTHIPDNSQGYQSDLVFIYGDYEPSMLSEEGRRVPRELGVPRKFVQFDRFSFLTFFCLIGS